MNSFPPPPKQSSYPPGGVIQIIIRSVDLARNTSAPDPTGEGNSPIKMLVLHTCKKTRVCKLIFLLLAQGTRFRALTCGQHMF